MFLRGLATSIALSLMTLQSSVVATQHCQTQEAQLRVWMRGGGHDEDSIWDNGRTHSMYLCMYDDEYTNGVVNAERVEFEIIGGDDGWIVYELDEDEGVNIGDVDCNTIYGNPRDGGCNWGSCLRILQSEPYPGQLEVEVRFRGVPGNRFMHFPHLSIYWNYGCCGWDMVKGDCTNRQRRTSRWVAEVFAEECAAVCGENTMYPGYLAIEDQSQYGYGRTDRQGQGQSYSGFRWTPDRTDHCNQAGWKLYDTTVACLVD